MKVAMGEEKADLVIMNAKLLNVYTGEFLDGYSVSIKGKRIAYVGDHPNHTVGPETVVIHAEGKTLIPGFIDGHTHLAFLYSGSEFLKFAMKGGTTTIITETMEAFPVAGYDGVVEFMDSLSDQPIKILGTIPAMVSTSRFTHAIPLETLRLLLNRSDMIGLGETYWQAIFQTPDQMIPVLNETLLHGKTIEGHSAGAKGKKLAAYFSTGISSCHEPITPDEVLERLRLGIHVMIREGSIRRDLENIVKIKGSGLDFRRLSLVTDGIDPCDLMEKGYMEYIVQKAIDFGFDPITAVQMATLNVAEHFRLDGLIGGIAPGKYADMVIIPDPETIDAEYVISNGQVIARNGELRVSPRCHLFSEKSRRSIHLSGKLKPSDFRIIVTDDAMMKEVRVIEQITELVTKEMTVQFPVIDGEIRPDLSKDILKIAAIDRNHHPGKRFIGFIKGFGMQSGAIASSAAWDTSDIIVIGANDADMAFAVNRIHELQGGAVVCSKEEVLSELPLPVFGIISDASMETIAERTLEIKKSAAELGVPFSDPLLTLNTLTGAAIPYLRICEEGLVNLRDGQTLGLFI